MAIRMSGLMSNMDTDSIIKDLMTAQRMKLTKIENKQTKLTWTQEKWKDLNAKIYKLYTDQVSQMRLQGSYKTLKATSTNESAVEVTANTGAPEGAQNIIVTKLASAQYLTGDTLGTNGKDVNGKDVTNSTLIKDLNATNNLVGKIVKVKDNNDKVISEIAITENTAIGDFVNALKNAGLNANYDTTQDRLFISAKASGTDNAFSFDVYSDPNAGAGTPREDIYNLVQNATIGSTPITGALGSAVDTALQSYVTATSDSGRSTALTSLTKTMTNQLKQRITTEVKATLDSKDPDYTTKLNDGIAAKYQDMYGKTEAEVNVDLAASLAPMVADYYADYQTATVEPTTDALDDLGLINNTITKVAENAEMEYNGVPINSQSNTVTINGLTFVAKQVTSSSGIDITVTKDVQATYDSVKKFLTEYNSIIKEMNTLYDAPTSKGYNPLTDDEKEAMTDDQIEKWENKIKDSLLRRDNSLGSLLTSMKSAMNSNITVTTKTGQIKNYNLTTYGITTSTDYTEKGLLHIYGDSTDSTFSDKEDKLKAALQDDPDAVMQTLSGIAKNLYTTMSDKMKTTSLKSALNFYNDKEMAKQQTRYSQDLSKMETKLTAMEDSYYKKFTAMETALAKLQESTAALSSFMG